MIVAVALAIVAVFAVTNVVTIVGSKGSIVNADEASISSADAIVVLGASVFADGTPSGILQDRLDDGIALYFAGVAPKLIMSGDNGTESYNEVRVMKQYAIAQGVPSEDIFCDHAGFSTYESMYRAKYVFGCQRIVVATQTYHLYRALWSAKSWGCRPRACRATITSTKNSCSTTSARCPRARKTSSRRCSACLQRTWAMPSALTRTAT